MKALALLVLGILIGLAAYRYVTNERSRSTIEDTQDEIVTGAREVKNAIQESLPDLKVRAEEIREELKRGGKTVREKAREAGVIVADATADARITAALKARLVADPELSALKISVNTTEGVVTLSGTASSEENIARAMNLALSMEGVREVISTLQVKPKG